MPSGSTVLTDPSDAAKAVLGTILLSSVAVGLAIKAITFNYIM